MKATPDSRHFSFVFPQRYVPLHAMIAGCGHQKVSSRTYDWDGLKRGKAEFFLFQYTLSGRGMLDHDGRKLELLPGTAMLVNIPHRHRYWWPPSAKPWEFIYIIIYGREVSRLWATLRGTCSPVVSMPANALPVKRVRQVIKLAAAGALCDAFEVSSLAYQFMMTLAATLVSKRTRGLPAKAFENVKAYCLSNFQEPIGVAEMANQAGLSRYHFSRLFRASNGISPGAFLLEIRLKEALRLLRDPRMSVKTVAERSGFSDANYFCRAFRKFAGVSPGGFRRNGIY